MIEQIYNIVVRATPDTPYEKWFIDMWNRRCIQQYENQHGDTYQAIVKEELANIGATMEYLMIDGRYSKFKLTFEDGNDYIVWALKWT